MVFIGQADPSLASRIMKRNGVDTRYVFFLRKFSEGEGRVRGGMCCNLKVRIVRHSRNIYAYKMPAIIHIVPFCLCYSRDSKIVRDAMMTENRLAAGTVLVVIVEAARCTMEGLSVYSKSSGTNHDQRTVP